MTDLHEWLSFDVEDETYQFDLTFLTSAWTCIFGRGCQGVLTGPAPELEQGCCSYGAHFTDKADRKRVADHAARLTEEQWQFKAEAEAEGGPIHRNDAKEWVTRQADDACIFLNRPDHPGGAGCALHRAALESGERPLDWKPDVCWQLPLRLEEHTDDNGHVTRILREWKRRDWGEGGAEFHWWCTDGPEAFVGGHPVWVELRDEIIELVGEVPFAALVEELSRRRPGQFLPHPALKTRP
jgi:hypothetical protein